MRDFQFGHAPFQRARTASGDESDGDAAARKHAQAVAILDVEGLVLIFPAQHHASVSQHAVHVEQRKFDLRGTFKDVAADVESGDEEWSFHVAENPKEVFTAKAQRKARIFG